MLETRDPIVESTAPRRLHIGGRVRVLGWEILDINPGPGVDHVSDAGNLGFFADQTFAAVYASHVLEHFDYTGNLMAALKEWNRVMMPGGTLYVSVPDLDVLARLFLDRELLSYPDRFLAMRMIFGGHMDKSDYHLVGLNEEFLTDVLRIAGFTGMQKVSSFGLFDDTSTTTLKGVPISVNILCTKPA
jgi:predicted SAM-dependent methyltransferase